MKRALFLVCLQALLAQQSPQAALPPPACADGEILEFGLECTAEEPCPVFLELSGVEQTGARLFVTGNFHTASATLWSLLMVSSDEGRTWAEPHPRLRGAALERVQFADAEAGWVAGHIAGALPRDPFFLKTLDGGRTWRRVNVFEESSYGAIDTFRFDSRAHGWLFLQRRGEPRQRYQRWETMTGGESWMLSEASPKPFAAPKPGPAGWRISTDTRTRTHVVERRADTRWSPAARLSVRAGECKPAPPAPKQEDHPPIP